MIWMAIPGYPGHEISDTALVRRVVLGRNGQRPQILSPWISKNTGYRMVSFYIGGKKKSATIHRLLLIAFKGPPPTPRHQAAHDDGNQTNLSLDNLFWKTPKENQADSDRHGTRCHGENSPNTHLKSEHVLEIRRLHLEDRITQRVVARKFGISQRTVWRICKGLTWRRLVQPGHRREAA